MWKCPQDKERDLIALFPKINYDSGDTTEPRFCMSYQQIGQHGQANYRMIMRQSRPTTKREYASLKRELETIGYKLKVL
jgi:hypothetical protein